ncbi:MAG: dihydroneopterin aldolase [Myxococcales bacterium]|nr:dihydroneopterin aldolase [Myxococcales bacterium]
MVGIYDHERVQPQPLFLDLDLDLDTAKAGYGGQISATINYARVADEVTALLEFRRYKLLEMAAEEIAAMLFGVHPMLDALRLRLRKPQALLGRAACAGVEVRRRRADFPRSHEASSFGQVEILHQTSEAGLYLLHIEPQREIPAHYHAVMRELEWLVDGAIERDGVRLRGFEPVVWPKQQVHRYVNVGRRRATLFCCDSPPFVPDDEILAGEA